MAIEKNTQGGIEFEHRNKDAIAKAQATKTTSKAKPEREGVKAPEEVQDIINRGGKPVDPKAEKPKPEKSKTVSPKITDEVSTKTMGTTDQNDCKKAVPDVVMFGEDLFKLMSKASSESEGWMKSTKAMEIPSKGCTVQVTTQQRNPDGSYSVAEALTFIPGVRLRESTDADGTVIGRELIGVR